MGGSRNSKVLLNPTFLQKQKKNKNGGVNFLLRCLSKDLYTPKK